MGLEVTAEVRRRVNVGDPLIESKKRGSIHRHRLTPTGQRWCAANLTAGRPDGAKFPAGVLFAVLESIAQDLDHGARSFDDFFKPDIELWIRSAYAELTIRRPAGSWVKLSDLRSWLDGVKAETLDFELDQMIEQPDVELIAEPGQSVLTEEDRAAAVTIGGEARNLLRIGTK
ncbi:hypothetical protein [Kineosporia sp. NBRC 101677]|uniref:hypothetical protein n=1 Tax=Kineosporia sp. NBRC 101677 TaxID=3032197 RepID=UPI002553393B|nr:hypothetical protein [Kineosporia sp. NBRC 101677]